jgi:hypothetical protein
MSGPHRNRDTDRTGCPPASEVRDADADEATEPNQMVRADLAEGSGEHDTDDFMRWLPTLALGHRRQAELVERPSSDGADFAAYAFKGRPAAPSGPRRIESVVNVQAASDSKDLERDAPTVLTGERRARRRWRGIGWACFGAVAAGAALAAWGERPVRNEKALQRGAAVAIAPMPNGRPSTQPVGAAPSTPAPLATPLQQAPSTDVARIAADRRALPSAAAVDAARKTDPAASPKPLPSSARRRSSPLATTPSLPAKDEYFEAP